MSDIVKHKLHTKSYFESRIEDAIANAVYDHLFEIRCTKMLVGSCSNALTEALKHIPQYMWLQRHRTSGVLTATLIVAFIPYILM